MLIRWKIREVVNKYGKGRLVLGLLAVAVVVYICLYIPACTTLVISDLLGRPRPKVFCMRFSGGLANHMFQYAVAYSMAKERNLQLIIDDDNMLIDYFNIKPNVFGDHGFNNKACCCFWVQQDDLDCGYDDRLENLPNTDLSFSGYFQSWKYWIKYEKDIRNKFQFNSDIVALADIQLRSILRERKVSAHNTTLIGIHIRNGDYSESYFASFGYQVAPASYLTSATNYYKNRFKNVLFIVCTNDFKWTSKVLSTENNIYIVKGNSAAVDMALLSMTNHTVMTVGTYGWMIAWLTRGTTIHYKYPYVPGSRFSRQFHKNYSDHFYPGWIAME